MGVCGHRGCFGVEVAVFVLFFYFGFFWVFFFLAI